MHGLGAYCAQRSGARDFLAMLSARRARRSNGEESWDDEFPQREAACPLL